MTCILSTLFMFAATALVCAGGTICFEAESAGEYEAPLIAVDATNHSSASKADVVKGASCDRYVEIARMKEKPPRPAPGKAVYSFEVDSAGTYVLWCRVWWQDECGNSFTMSIDDGPGFAFGQDSTFKTWHWVRAPAKLKQLDLAKGKHTLTVRNREDGVKMDQILLTTDPKYVPVDIENVTVNTETGHKDSK